MKNNIVPTTQKISTQVDYVNFVLPHGDGIYKLFVNPESLHLEAIQFWSDTIEESILIMSNQKALAQFCVDIDIHVEKNIPIPQKVWDIIKANKKIRSLWFVDGLNINNE